MPKNVAVPRVPGVADAGKQTPPQDEGETVSVPKAQLEALLARVAALEATQPTARRANPEADLPDAGTIDQSALKSPVLTKQGWLVPEKFGANPGAQKL